MCKLDSFGKINLVQESDYQKEREARQSRKIKSAELACPLLKWNPTDCHNLINHSLLAGHQELF